VIEGSWTNSTRGSEGHELKTIMQAVVKGCGKLIGIFAYVNRGKFGAKETCPFCEDSWPFNVQYAHGTELSQDDKALVFDKY